MSPAAKKVKVCDKCGGNNIKARRTTYPLKFADKQIDVGRVSVRECLDCHDMIPTKAGEEKIARCMMSFMSLMGK